MKRHQKVKSKRAASKRKKRILASLAIAGVACGGSAARADTMTTLIGVPGTFTNDPVPLDHGSNAEVGLTWSTESIITPEGDWDQYANWDGRGDVYQIDQRTASIAFAPTASNIKVTIDSFELDKWGGGPNISVAWSVKDSSNGVLASDTWNAASAFSGRAPFSPMASGAAGETLTLSFEQLQTGSIAYLAMDNLTFSSQVIPEPSTMMMACLGVGGLGAMAMRRKRK